MKKIIILFLILPLVGLSQNANKHSKKTEKESDVSVTVTREYDQKGNIIKYDSIHITPRRKIRIKTSISDSLPSHMQILPPDFGGIIDDFDFFHIDSIDYTSEFRSIWDKMDMWPKNQKHRQKLDSIFEVLPSVVLGKLSDLNHDFFFTDSEIDSLTIKMRSKKPRPIIHRMNHRGRHNRHAPRSFPSQPRFHDLDSLMRKNLDQLEDYMERFEKILEEYEGDQPKQEIL